MLGILWRRGRLTAAERLSLALDFAHGSGLVGRELLAEMARDSEPLVALTALALAGAFSTR